LVRLSVSDRTLDRTRELMLLSAERFGNQMLAGQIRDFAGAVLRRHPAFLIESLAGVLANLPDAIGDEAAIDALASQSFAALPWPEGLAPLKKNEAEQCRLNAVCCLLLWFRETRGTPTEQVQRHLHAVAWTPTAVRYKTDAQKLRVLMQARDRAALGIACSTLEKKVREQRQEAVAARGAEERASARAKQLEQELGEANTMLETGEARAQSLTEQIANAKREHENEKAHMRNDYEELRGRVLRRLRQEVSLLDEGLHALKRHPPKIHVMEDHAERAIDGLKGEIEHIQGGE
jgi:hypothetical protein